MAEETEPRPDAAIALDDLRATAKVLLDGGLEPARIVSWLMSRDAASFENGRPIDCLRRSPVRVLSAAQLEVLELS